MSSSSSRVCRSAPVSASVALGGDVMDVLRDEKRASRQLSAQNNAKSSHHWQIFGSIWVGALFAHICGSAQDGAHEALHASIHSLKAHPRTHPLFNSKNCIGISSGRLHRRPVRRSAPPSYLLRRCREAVASFRPGGRATLASILHPARPRAAEESRNPFMRTRCRLHPTPTPCLRPLPELPAQRARLP